MAVKWTWEKYDFSNMQKKHPNIAKYDYLLIDDRGFTRGNVVYFPKTKRYVAYSMKSKYGEEKLGEFKFLSDAKRTVEADWGKRITRARKNTDWHPFGL